MASDPLAVARLVAFGRRVLLHRAGVSPEVDGATRLDISEANRILPHSLGNNAGQAMEDEDRKRKAKAGRSPTARPTRLFMNRAAMRAGSTQLQSDVMSGRLLASRGF